VKATQPLLRNAGGDVMVLQDTKVSSFLTIYGLLNKKALLLQGDRMMLQ